MDLRDLINYSKLSEYYGLKGNGIRRGRIPEKYREGVEELMDLLKYWDNRQREEEDEDRSTAV